MKQRAHAWAAFRALKMIDDWGKAPKLVEMLSYYLSDVWDGVWLPDIRICDMRYGHIYKMDSDPNYISAGHQINKRYVQKYADLKKKLVGKRHCLNYVKGSDELNNPYRSHTKEGGHLPNRVIALSHSIGDMLKMSDFPLGKYCKKKHSEEVITTDASGTIQKITARKIRDLARSPNFSARQISLTFFLLSHYICDAHMPLHCDLRDLSVHNKKRRLPRSLHPWIEKFWDNCFPEKEDLILHEYKKESLDEVVLDKFPKDSIIEIDNSNSKYKLNTAVNKNLKGDEWNEMIYTTRVSYAVARKWISPSEDWFILKKQKFKTYSPFKKAVASGHGFGDGIFVEDFHNVTNMLFHDVVESIARIWYKAWLRFID